MAWTHIPPRQCTMPLFGSLFQPHGSIWTCDTCGKRWLLECTRTASGTKTRWLDASPSAIAVRLANEIQANQSMDPADVGRRELASARLWLTRHVNAVYADLGLERTP